MFRCPKCGRQETSASCAVFCIDCYTFKDAGFVDRCPFCGAEIKSASWGTAVGRKWNDHMSQCNGYAAALLTGEVKLWQSQ